MKPSDIEIIDSVPLGATFGHVEAEMMGTIMICALRFDKDEWRPVTHDMRANFIDSVKDDLPSWMKNPYLRPDGNDLVNRGFASWTDDDGTIEFTDKGIEALRNCRWNKAEG